MIRQSLGYTFSVRICYAITWSSQKFPAYSQLSSQTYFTAIDTLMTYIYIIIWNLNTHTPTLITQRNGNNSNRHIIGGLEWVIEEPANKTNFVHLTLQIPNKNQNIKYIYMYICILQQTTNGSMDDFKITHIKNH